MDATVRTDEAALFDLAAEWDSLFEKDPAASAFHTPEYATAAWETELGADRAFAAIEIRRKGRRLERETGPYVVRLSTNETLDGDLDRFYQMHRSSQGPKGRFMHEDVAALFDRIARAFQGRGRLRMSWLE